MLLVVRVKVLAVEILNPLGSRMLSRWAAVAKERNASSAPEWREGVRAGGSEWTNAQRGERTLLQAAATQLPPSYGVITPAAAAAWGAQMAAQAQAAAAQTAAATPTQTL